MTTKRFKELEIGDVFEIGGTPLEVVRVGQDFEFRDFVWVHPGNPWRNFKLVLPKNFQIEVTGRTNRNAGKKEIETLQDM